MKKNVISTLLMTLISLPALAVSLPGWERPVRNAEMKIVQAQFEFATVQDVSLSLNKQDGAENATSITLKYKTQNGETLTHTLPMSGEPTMDRCGTVTYHAALANTEANDGLYERMNVTLVDHSLRRCRDLKPAQWEASVRHGFGFCGTFDGTMQLQGNPEAVYTIMGVNTLAIQ